MRLIHRWVALVCVSALLSPDPARGDQGEWHSYGGSLANHKFAALDQINQDNVKQRLKIAWRWRSLDEDKKKGSRCSPLATRRHAPDGRRQIVCKHGNGSDSGDRRGFRKNDMGDDPGSYETGKAPGYGFNSSGCCLLARR
jgi:hypothetical protein